MPVYCSRLINLTFPCKVDFFPGKMPASTVVTTRQINSRYMALTGRIKTAFSYCRRLSKLSGQFFMRVCFRIDQKNVHKHTLKCAYTQSARTHARALTHTREHTHTHTHTRTHTQHIHIYARVFSQTLVINVNNRCMSIKLGQVIGLTSQSAWHSVVPYGR